MTRPERSSERYPEHGGRVSDASATHPDGIRQRRRLGHYSVLRLGVRTRSMVIRPRSCRPASPLIDTTLPLTGAGTSTRRLVGHHLDDDLVLFYRVSWVSGMPGHDLRLHGAFAEIRHLEDELTHATSMTVSSARLDARLSGKIFPLERMRIGRIPAGDALDRRLEVPESTPLESPTGSPHRSRRNAWLHGRRRSVRSFFTDVQIVRRRRGGTKDRRSMISASSPRDGGGSQRHENHRAIGDDGHVRAAAHDLCLAQRHRVIDPRSLGLFGCAVHGTAGFARITVEGAVVEPLGFEEDHRIVVLDRGDEQAPSRRMDLMASRL